MMKQRVRATTDSGEGGKNTMNHASVIFLDIDGTLTIPGHQEPPASAVEAIRRARKAGRRVYLCTGRCEAMLRPVLACTEFDGYVASSGGLVISHGRTLVDMPLPEAQQRHVLDVLHQEGVFRTVQTRQGAYCDESFRDFLRSRDATGGGSELLRWREAIEDRLAIRPMAEYGGESAYSVVCMSPTRVQLDRAMAQLPELDFLVMEDREHGIVNAETVDRRYDKGSGLAAVCRAEGVEAAQSICFGDSMNDLPMMRAAGFSVCMGNGSAEAKAAADAVCASVEEDGLYNAFAAYGLMA